MRKGVIPLMAIVGVFVFFIIAGTSLYFISVKPQTKPLPSPLPFIQSPQSSTISKSTPTPNILTQDNCGKVTTHGNNMPALDSGSKHVEDCLWNNYTNCIPASLTLVYFGVDAGSNTVFNISKVDEKCQINGYSQSYMIPKGNGEKNPFSCEKFTKDASGLHAINCNYKSGVIDILIPSYNKA